MGKCPDCGVETLNEGLCDNCVIKPDADLIIGELAGLLQGLQGAARLNGRQYLGAGYAHFAKLYDILCDNKWSTTDQIDDAIRGYLLSSEVPVSN